MHCVRKVTEDLYWVGSNDRRLELFENIFPIQKGVSYNSYLLLDEKTVLFDTVDSAGRRSQLSTYENAQDYLQRRHVEEAQDSFPATLPLRHQTADIRPSGHPS